MMVLGSQLWAVLTLQDYNTRVVVLGTAALGMAAGMIGTFMLLRKRALLGDALSHSALPGIAVAFLVMAGAGGSGKWLPGLLLGATLSGVLGIAWIVLIRSWTRLKEDAALGIVLSVLFGAGVALLGIIQHMASGSAAGLEGFIYGKPASMLQADAIAMAVTAAAIAVLCSVLFKELQLLCFDPGFARAQGWPVARLDWFLMALVTAVTVIGLQAVGLILVLALLVIPPAAARFWTERLWRMFVGSALIGALSGMVGASVSALVPRLPAGAIIVLVAAGIFLLSLLLAPQRGALPRLWRHGVLRRTVARQHLLRSLYEMSEPAGGRGGVPLSALLARRSWSAGELRRELRRARRQGLVQVAQGLVELTPPGLQQAQRLVRNHRLWELYLITHADVAASHVDRDADALEHVLGRQMVSELENLLSAQVRTEVPRSPHVLSEGTHAR